MEFFAGSSLVSQTTPTRRLMRPERSSWWTSRTRPFPSELQYEKPENYWIVQLLQGMFKVALGLGALIGVGFLLVAAMTELSLIDHMGMAFIESSTSSASTSSHCPTMT